MSDNITWSCEVCGEVKPDAEIAVTTHDHSSYYYDLPKGTIQRNVRHCLDPTCVAAAGTESLWRPSMRMEE